MTIDAEVPFLADVETRLGRRLTTEERVLASSLQADKTPELIARELAGAPVTDPRKIRPEQNDTASEADA
jgi:hypothetical protein